MAWFVAAAPYIAAAGTVISAEQQRKAGEIEAMNANFEAKQLEREANTASAESQREAIKARREAKYMESRTRALAAASGGGASDPTVVNLIDQIADEGEYNALRALYNGQQRANSMITSAGLARSAGRNAKSAGRTMAASTYIGGAAKFAEHFTPPDERPIERRKDTALTGARPLSRYA